MDVTEKQNEKNDNWALFEAIESRDLGTLESLLRKGVSPNVQVVNRNFLWEKICEWTKEKEEDSLCFVLLIYDNFSAYILRYCIWMKTSLAIERLWVIYWQ